MNLMQLFDTIKIMKICFVRHGQTQYNKEGRCTGHIDDLLTAEGIKEAERALKDLSNDFNIIYSSDLIRCKQTAEILNRNFKMPIVYDTRLRERNFGSLVGEYWAKWNSVLLEKDKNQQYDYRPFGGESVEDVKKRLFSFVLEIQKKHKNDKVLISTHGGIIRLLLNNVKNEVRGHIDNNSIHEFEFPD